MAEAKLWYLVAYDIRENKRWRKVYKLLKGYGKRVQYSIFRCRMTARQLEKMRFELESHLVDEDSILFVGLCEGCVARIEAKNKPEQWEMVQETFKVI